jgi:glycogen(starch) synthase
MKLAFYTPTLPGVSGDGGIGTYVRAVGRALVGRGHSVHVLTPGPPGHREVDGLQVWTDDYASPRRIDRLVPGASGCFRLDRTIARLHDTGKIELVEFTNWEGKGLVTTARRRLPTVVRLATSTLETIGIDKPRLTRDLVWDVRRERWMGRTASALVTHSYVHRDLMAEELGVPAEAIDVVPLGIERMPQPPDGDFPERRGDLVVYLGRLEARKGTLALLRAIPRVLERAPRTRFVIIGADRAHAPGGRGHIEYFRSEFPASIQSSVTFTGRLPQSEVDAWMRQADVFVAPSLYESFGLIFVEAMQWSLPVIGTFAGGIPEIVEDGVNGLLVRPDDDEHLASAIGRLIDDASLRSSMGRAGRKRFEEHFTAEVMAARMEPLYRRLLDATR